MSRLPLAVVLLLAACPAPGRLNVVMGAEELERELGRSFPVKREASVLFVELAEPRVVLQRGADQLGLKLRASVGVAILRLEGTLSVKGRLRYEANDGFFFLDQPEVTAFEVPGLPAAEEPHVLGIVNDVTRTVLPTVPIHQLKQGTTRMLLKSVRVEDGRVVAELGL